MNDVKWTIHQVDTGENDAAPMFALLPDNSTRGILIGELNKVADATDALTHFLATGGHAGTIPDTHAQLGHPHHTAYSASREFGVPVSSISAACRDGGIVATKDERGRWQFTQRAFVAWYAKRPGHGGRPRKIFEKGGI